MKDYLKFMWVMLVIIFSISVLGFVIQGTDFFMYKFFAPKQEAVRRQVFENTKSFNDGMIQELQSFQIEYAKGNNDVKDAISNTVTHRYASYNDVNLSYDLKVFVKECKSRQMGGK